MSEEYPTLWAAQAEIARQKKAEALDIREQFIADNPPLIYLGWKDEGYTVWFAPKKNTVRTLGPRDLIPSILNPLALFEKWVEFYVSFTPSYDPNKPPTEKEIWQAIIKKLHAVTNEGDNSLKIYKSDTIRAAGLYRETINGEPGTFFFCGTSFNCFFYSDSDPTHPRRVLPLQQRYTYFDKSRSLPCPATSPTTAAEGKKIHQFFAARMWNMDSDLAGTIITGWIAMSLLAAVDMSKIGFRPQIWITGIKETGKTTLLNDLKGIFGRREDSDPWYGTEVENISSTTLAGLRQKIASCPGPVFFDEIEEDNKKFTKEKIEGVLDIIRAAATNHTPAVTHGTASGTHQTYFMRNSFCLCSCVAILTRPTDRSRIIELPLQITPPSSSQATYETMITLRKELFTLDFAPRLVYRIITNVQRILRTIDTLHTTLLPIVRSSRQAARLAAIFAGDFVLCSDAEITDADINSYVARAKLLEEELEQEEPFYKAINYLTQIIVRVGTDNMALGQVIAYLLDPTVSQPDTNYAQASILFGIHRYRAFATAPLYLQIDYANKNLIAEFSKYSRGDNFWKDFADGCQGSDPNKYGVIRKVLSSPENWRIKKRYILIPASVLPSLHPEINEQDD